MLKQFHTRLVTCVKALAILLSVALLTAMNPSTASADTPIDSLSALETALAASNTVTLTGDIELNADLAWVNMTGKTVHLNGKYFNITDRNANIDFGGVTLDGDDGKGGIISNVAGNLSDELKISNVKLQKIDHSDTTTEGVIYIGRGNNELKARLTNITVTNCKGAIIQLHGESVLTNVTVENNTSTATGMIKQNIIGKSLTLNNCSVKNNVVSGVSNTNGYGGGVASWGSLTVKNSDISSNKNSASGGGIFANGDTIIEDSIISGNSAAGYAGGIFVQGGNISVKDSKIENNSAQLIGGIMCNGGGSATVSGQSTVIAGNTSTGNTSSLPPGSDDIHPAQTVTWVDLVKTTLVTAINSAHVQSKGASAKLSTADALVVALRAENLSNAQVTALTNYETARDAVAVAQDALDLAAEKGIEVLASATEQFSINAAESDIKAKITTLSNKLTELQAKLSALDALLQRTLPTISVTPGQLSAYKGSELPDVPRPAFNDSNTGASVAGSYAWDSSVVNNVAGAVAWKVIFTPTNIAEYTAADFSVNVLVLDKTELDKYIEKAKYFLDWAKDREGSGDKQVSTAAIKALSDAIAAAQTVADTAPASNTQQAIGDALGALKVALAVLDVNDTRLDKAQLKTTIETTNGKNKAAVSAIATAKALVDAIAPVSLSPAQGAKLVAYKAALTAVESAQSSLDTAISAGISKLEGTVPAINQSDIDAAKNDILAKVTALESVLTALAGAESALNTALNRVTPVVSGAAPAAFSLYLNAALPTAVPSRDFVDLSSGAPVAGSYAWDSSVVNNVAGAVAWKVIFTPTNIAEYTAADFSVNVLVLDKTELDKYIEKAKYFLDWAKDREGSGDKQVSTAAIKALSDAIAAAQTVADTAPASNTQQAIGDALGALKVALAVLDVNIAKNNNQQAPNGGGTDASKQDVQKIRTVLKTIYIKAKDNKDFTLPYILDTANGKPIFDPGLKATSSNTGIVKVSKDSYSLKIRGSKAGKATVTITTRNGKTYSVKVVVVKKATKLQKLNLKAPVKLNEGNSYQLNISKTTKKATNVYRVRFASSNNKVLIVDRVGKITAVGKGKAKITVTLGSKKVVKTITVN